MQALPVLRMLKRHQPESEIFWWIKAELAPLLEGDPDLSGRFIFERTRWKRPDWALTVLRGIRAMRRKRWRRARTP